MSYQLTLIITYYSDLLCHQLNKTETVKKLIECVYGVIIRDCLTDYIELTFNKSLEMNTCYNETSQIKDNNTNFKLDYKPQSINSVDFILFLISLTILAILFIMYILYKCDYLNFKCNRNKNNLYSNNRLYGTINL